MKSLIDITWKLHCGGVLSWHLVLSFEEVPCTAPDKHTVVPFHQIVLPVMELHVEQVNMKSARAGAETV